MRTPSESPPPECTPTLDALQRVLDGEADTTLDALAAGRHARACPTCRERLRAAQMLLAVLAAPPEPTPALTGF
ncbi:MAG: hypothetical protein K2V38_29685, partial [Gemmataceae bacterium]|nr:hypothetical protein [Gemmataceae bacterium]